jgi:hypothetical protein
MEVLSPLEAFVQGIKSTFQQPPPRAKMATYGMLESWQEDRLRPFVHGRRLVDYGCGNLVFTLQVLALGARHVLAYDKERVSVPAEVRHRLSFTQGCFLDRPPTMRTAIASWPYNTDTGLDLRLTTAPRIIYVGRNTGGTVCGYVDFWLELFRREVLCYAPDEHNVLIVYGDYLTRRRKLMPEEYAAIAQRSYLSYEDAHARAEWDIPRKWRTSV